jgi:S1-C subfamily serine protease
MPEAAPVTTAMWSWRRGTGVSSAFGFGQVEQAYGENGYGPVCTKSGRMFRSPKVRGAKFSTSLHRHYRCVAARNGNILIEYTSDPIHDALYQLLSEECQTADRFVDYCTRQNLKDVSIRKLGLVSHQEMLELLLGKSAQGVRTDNRLYRAYDALIESDVFTKVSLGARQFYDLQINFMMVLIYSQLGCLENIIKGPVFTVTKYARSTVAIVVEKQNEEFAGTGSLMTNGHDFFVLTNRHNVDPDEGCHLKNVFLGGDVGTELKISSPPRLCGTDDLAVLPVLQRDLPLNVPPFRLSTGASILQKVTTLAYPSIPRTNNFHLTAHTGEINAQINTRDGRELFLISCYAAPGSSGGPVLDSRGLILGVVSERLEGRYEDGIFDHTAAVPYQRILGFLENKL